MMKTRLGTSALLGALLLAVPIPAARAATAAEQCAVVDSFDEPAALQLAQAGGTTNRELQPRYTPVQEEPPGWYNGSYIFGMTRGLAASTIHPAAKGPLFLFTVPLDIVFLPFAAIGGFF